MNLSKRSFLALAAVGWADGSLQRIEAIGLLRAAKEAGLSDADYAEIEASTKNKVSIDDVDVSDMPPWDQVLTYALAAWFAQLDGVHSSDEQAVMVQLGNRMGLSDGMRKRASAVAYDIACLPEGGRPERYDFQKLVTRIGERMPQLGRPTGAPPSGGTSGTPTTPPGSDGGGTPTTPPGSGGEASGTPTTPPGSDS